VEARQGLARYEKAKRNRQGFASLAVLLRPGWFQAMGRDGGQPRQPWPFFDLFRSAKWTLRRGAVRVVKRGNFRGYSSQTTLSDRAHFSQRHVEKSGAPFYLAQRCCRGLLALERYASPKVHRQRQSRYRPFEAIDKIL
jgi:hypothetical protein